MLRDEDGAGAGFYLQQSLEKYLKGFLLAQEWDLRKIHALQALLDDAVQYRPDLARFRGLCRRVSGYYVLQRYPFAGEGPDASQIRADLEEARTLILALFPDEHLE
jgi:HEPN domain-containing protein